MTAPERADLKDRCSICHRHHNIDIGIEELCFRIQSAENLLRDIVTDDPSFAAAVKAHFDKWR